MHNRPCDNKHAGHAGELDVCGGPAPALGDMQLREDQNTVCGNPEAINKYNDKIEED